MGLILLGGRGACSERSSDHVSGGEAGVSTLHEINRVTFVEEVKMNGDEIVSVGSET